MNPYYQDLLNQYTGNLYTPPQPQKSPEMLVNEMKQQKYQEFLTTQEGSEAISELRVKFDNWYNSKYNPGSSTDAKELKELKDMMANLAQQNQVLAQQIQAMTATRPHDNNQNRKNV